MKHRNIAIVAALVPTAALLYLLSVPSVLEVPAPQPLRQSVKTSGSSSKRANGALVQPQPLKVDLSKTTITATAADIARFLAKEGETPANLFAAFDATGDRIWLERALQLFPNNAAVLLALLASKPPDDQIPALIERFKQADANNPLPWFFAAQQLFKNGRNDEALAEIRTALDPPGFYTYQNERISAAQRLYETLGMNPLEAELAAVFQLRMQHVGAVQQVIKGLRDIQKSSAESGDLVNSAEATRLAYGISRMFSTPEASRLMIGQLFSLGVERKVLESLPDGAQPDYLTKTPAARLAEIQQEIQQSRSLINAMDLGNLQKDTGQFSEYLRRVRQEGEFSALLWLQQQPRPSH